MSAVEQGFQTQLANIPKRTGKTLDELYAVIRASGLQKHGEIVKMLKADLGVGHGDANTLVHTYNKLASDPSGAGESPPPGDVLDAIYTGSKAPLRPLHDAVMRQIEKFGAFEVAPKKAYVSLRRKKQFAMVGPGSKGRVEVGLNMKGVDGTDRLIALPPGGMCQYKMFVAAAGEIDAEFVAWVRQAYEAAG